MKPKLDKEFLSTVIEPAKRHLDTLTAHIASVTKSEDVDTNKAALHLGAAADAIKAGSDHVHNATKPVEHQVTIPTAVLHTGNGLLAPLAAKTPTNWERVALIVMCSIIVAGLLAYGLHKVGAY